MQSNITGEQLKERLTRGVVFFDFTKKDGTIRKALGTTHPGIVNGILSPENEIITGAVAVVKELDECIKVAEASDEGGAPDDFITEHVREQADRVMQLIAADNVKRKKQSERVAGAGIVYFDLEKNEFRSIAADAELHLYFPE